MFQALPHFFLYMFQYLVLCGGSWTNWALYKDIRIDQFAFFYILTASWTCTFYWKCCIFFFYWIVLASFSKIKWPYVCGFNSGSSILFHWSSCLPLYQYCAFFFYHYCYVIQLEVRYGDSPRRSFIFENRFWSPGLFFIPNEFANWSFYEEFHEELSWNFDVDYIESVDCF